MTLLGNITGNEISIIKDPFKKDCVGDIGIYYMSSCSVAYWWAKVEFKNGNTKGEQRTPDCKTFEDVITHLKQILNTINK